MPDPLEELREMNRKNARDLVILTIWIAVWYIVLYDPFAIARYLERLI